MPAALISGLVGDLILRIAAQRGTLVATVAFGAATPALWTALHFATLAATSEIGWSPHFWVGAIVVAGLVGGCVALLLALREGGTMGDGVRLGVAGGAA